MIHRHALNPEKAARSDCLRLFRPKTGTDKPILITKD